MQKLNEKSTRKDVLLAIARSAYYGNLGAFIGAGFSKAVSENPLGWGDLLEAVGKDLKIDVSDLEHEGLSFPDIASKMCIQYKQQKDIAYKDAVKVFKETIARQTGWYPDNGKQEQFSGYLLSLDPSWIITTNYDSILEALLPGKAITLGPGDNLIASKDNIPIYHLHGTRTNPEDIIMTQEDYVRLFRPTEYRQTKLTLLLRESTTLILGYGLGDVNVLTALDWSKNVYDSKRQNYPHEVIQVYRNANPRNEPYIDHNGIVVIETEELESFFNEYEPIRAEHHGFREKHRITELRIRKTYADAKPHIIDGFINNEEARAQVLKGMFEIPFMLPCTQEFLTFFTKSMDETWKRAKPKGAFEAYNANLKIILDVLTIFDFDNIPPALLSAVAYEFSRVAYYIGADLGKSHAAHETWTDRKNELSPEMIQELKNISALYNYSELLELLDNIKP